MWGTSRCCPVSAEFAKWLGRDIESGIIATMTRYGLTGYIGFECRMHQMRIFLNSEDVVDAWTASHVCLHPFIARIDRAINMEGVGQPVTPTTQGLAEP